MALILPELLAEPTVFVKFSYLLEMGELLAVVGPANLALREVLCRLEYLDG